MSARNEQLKISATFWNNLAVATIAGGIFLPFYSVARDPGQATVLVQDMISPSLVYTLVITLGAAAMMKARASSILTKIED